MVPSDFANFFVASTGAGAALVGLLFVAIAVSPENTIMSGAPWERRAVASSSFTALLNAFFISLGALLPHTNMAYFTLAMSSFGIINSLMLGISEFFKPMKWSTGLRRFVLILTGIAIYGFEFYYALLLLLSPNDIGFVLVLATLIMSVYGLGVIRAWELIGASRFGLFRWLNPLYEVNERGGLESENNKDKKGV